MENAEFDVMPIEEIERKLLELCTPDSPGLAPGPAYQAAQLFEKVNAEFKAAEGKVKILDVWTFEDWIAKFRQTLRERRNVLNLDLRRIISRRQIFKYVQVGRCLIPQTHMTESEFKALGGFEKAVILADVAEAGRLTPDLLKASANYTRKELEEEVAPLLGKKVSWEKYLKIDSHEAAEASLIVMGNLLGHKTYTAHPAHKFGGQELRDMATLPELPHFASEEVMDSVKYVDVIWLDENAEHPEYFFEVEHSQDVTGALIRMYKAWWYPPEFFIVGPELQRGRFERQIEKSPIKDVKDKYHFRTYAQLLNMFRAARKYYDAHADFFEKQE
jgi:hypothetical protein